MERIISFVTAPGADTPTNTSASTMASAKILVLLFIGDPSHFFFKESFPGRPS
jgi:hypothetical protein